jgi:hypothetical protein
MKPIQPININALLKQAEASEDKETYQNINKTSTCKLGVGARVGAPQPSFFIEIIVNLCPDCSEVDLTFLEQALNCLKELKANGYTLNCHDDNNISCEKPVNANIEDECNIANALVIRFFQPLKSP